MSAGQSHRIIWLSDLHFLAQGDFMGHDPRLRLQAAIEFINAHYLDGDLCLISGDMVEDATDQNYTAVRDHLNALALPWFPMTGNHDDHAMLRAHLPLPPGTMPGFVQYVIDLPLVRLICLDSLKPGAGSGLLCADRLAWLRHMLAADADKPAIIFLHHPPVPLGLPMLDPARLENGDELLHLLAQYPAVQHLCFGHVHRPISGRAGRLSYSGINSVLYQAPPPCPAWDWDSFRPAPEAPLLGVIDITLSRINIQFIPFCDASLGVTPTA